MSQRTPNTLRLLVRNSCSARATTSRKVPARKLSTLQRSIYRTPSQNSSFLPRPYISASRFSTTPISRTETPSPSARQAEAIESAIETIQDLYGTARDEFEMAIEETEKNTTYAEEDRAAAREELDKLLEFYGDIIEGGDRAVAEVVKQRVGGRIRELEAAVLAMEEKVSHGD